MSISKYVNREVLTLKENAFLLEAIQIMQKENVGSIIVIQDQQQKIPLGILTDRDIAIQFSQHSDNIKTLKVADCLSKELLCIKEHQGMHEVIEALRDKGVRRAPVIGENNQLTGIITLDDLLVSIIQKLNQIGELIKKQMP